MWRQPEIGKGLHMAPATNSGTTLLSALLLLLIASFQAE
jgi:hypothetical protein